jgi:predicted nucleic acid-binding protein
MDELCPVLLLDTNVVLDWLAFGDAAIVPIAEAVASGRVRLISSAACIDELQRALGYKAIKLDAAAQARALATYRGRAELRDAPPEGSLPMLPRCEDRDDQKFLELARDCGADYLVTKDKALLILARRKTRPPPCRIVTPPEMGAILTTHSPTQCATLVVPYAAPVT